MLLFPWYEPDLRSSEEIGPVLPAHAGGFEGTASRFSRSVRGEKTEKFELSRNKPERKMTGDLPVFSRSGFFSKGSVNSTGRETFAVSREAERGDTFPSGFPKTCGKTFSESPDFSTACGKTLLINVKMNGVFKKVLADMISENREFIRAGSPSGSR